MSTFNPGTYQSGDGNLNEPILVGRLGQPLKLGGGTAFTSHGSGPIADRPSAADFGVGTWQDGIAKYTSNGVGWDIDKEINNNSFVLFGDSITSNCNASFLPVVSSISRIGDTVTVACAAPVLIPVGTKMKIANLMPDDFNGIIEVATATGNSLTYTKAGTQGDAIITGSPNPSGGTIELKLLNTFAHNGFWMWTNGLMGGGLDLVMNCARGGWTANYMASVLDLREAEITATGKIAKNAYVRMGINDINAGRTAAEIIASLTAIVLHNIKQGRRVFLDTILPLGSGHASFNAANNAKITTVNRWILKDAPKLLGIYPIDTYSTIVTPTTGASIANTLADNIHPSAAGQIQYIAPAIKAEFSKYISVSSILPAAIVDTYGASANSNNYCDIGPWVNTGGGAISGTVTPGASGVALGLTVLEFGAASSVAAQINTNAAGYIEQQVDLGGTVALGDYAEIIHTFTHSRLTVGAEYKFCYRVELANLSAATGNAHSFAGYLEIVASGATSYIYLGQYSNSWLFDAVVGAGAYTYDMVSAPFKVPAGITLAKLRIRLEGAGAVAGSAASMKISRIGLIPA